MATYATGYHTEAAGTEITEVCPPNSDMVPVLRGFSCTVAGTEHNLYVMSPLGVTTAGAPTASGDTTIELAKMDPGQTTAGVDEGLAAGDWIAYETQYGNLEARKISSVSGNDVTIPATTDDVENGAKVWAFYEAGRSTNKQIRLPASGTTTYDNLFIQGGIPHQDGIQTSVTGQGMPMLIVIDNATAASKLEWVSFQWFPANQDFSK